MLQVRLSMYDLLVDTMNQRVNNKLTLSLGPYHMETSQLICKANQWTGFYMIRTSVMKVFIDWEKNPSWRNWVLLLRKIVETK